MNPKKDTIRGLDERIETSTLSKGKGDRKETEKQWEWRENI